MRNISGGANTCARWNPGAAELSNFSSILSIGVSPNISPIICIISSIWCCIIVIGDVCAKRLDKGDDGYMYLDTGARVRCCTGAFIDDTFSPRVSSRAVCGDSARVVVISWYALVGCAIVKLRPWTRSRPETRRPGAPGPPREGFCAIGSYMILRSYIILVTTSWSYNDYPL